MYNLKNNNKTNTSVSMTELKKQKSFVYIFLIAPLPSFQWEHLS